jgi:Zn-dependent membrane protease YugP
MDWDDYFEAIGEGNFGLTAMLAVGALTAGWLVQKAALNFQRVQGLYLGVPSSCGLSGADVARYLLEAIGLKKVGVGRAGLRDQYLPATADVLLTDHNFESASLASLATAAHEVGHAEQFAAGYFPSRMRSLVIRVSYGLLILSFILLAWGAASLEITSTGGAILGICALAITLQGAVILPMEFDASARAQRMLRETGLIDESEAEPIRELLRVAAMTYIAREGQRWIYVVLVGGMTVWMAGQQF